MKRNLGGGQGQRNGGKHSRGDGAIAPYCNQNTSLSTLGGPQNRRMILKKSQVEAWVRNGTGIERVIKQDSLQDLWQDP